MKIKNLFFSLLAALFLLPFAACNRNPHYTMTIEEMELMVQDVNKMLPIEKNGVFFEELHLDTANNCVNVVLYVSDSASELDSLLSIDFFYPQDLHAYLVSLRDFIDSFDDDKDRNNSIYPDYYPSYKDWDEHSDEICKIALNVLDNKMEEFCQDSTIIDGEIFGGLEKELFMQLKDKNSIAYKLFREFTLRDMDLEIAMWNAEDTLSGVPGYVFMPHYFAFELAGFEIWKKEEVH